MIIGLAGAAGCGKNTAAAILRRKRRVVEMAFADPLYEMISAFTGMTVERLKDRVVKEQAIEWLGKSPRELLQTLGTEWGRGCVANDVWVRHLLARIDAYAVAWGRVVSDDPVVCVTDVRFLNEAEAIKSRGGVIWRIERPAARCLSQAAAGHSSEAGLAYGLADDTVVNDGDLEAFAAAVNAAFGRLHAAII